MNPKNSVEKPTSHHHAVLDLVKRALRADVPLYDVLAAVEKAVLAEALRRHDSLSAVCSGLRIPRTSFYAKRKRFFDDPPSFSF